MNLPEYLQWLNAKAAGNELWRLLGFLVAVTAAVVVGRVGRFLLEQQARRIRAGHSASNALLVALARSAGLIMVSIGARFGLELLVVPARFFDACRTGTAVLFTVALASFAYNLVIVAEVWLKRAAAATDSKLDDMLVPMVRSSLRIFVIVLAALQIATQLSDKPVTSLLAGLGVGGLALALAAQETVKNFFGSIMIFADKPFEVGDRIVVDGFDGPVETVGFRSTRIRTLEGHLVTIPNGELANKSILNIGKRPYIRRLMNIAVTYDTPPAKLQEALDIARDILKDHEGIHPDFPPRVYFDDFKDAWLNIKAIYWYHPPDYWTFMAHAEKVNMELLRRFNEAGISFAFPTQTIHLAGGGLPSRGTACAGGGAG